MVNGQSCRRAPKRTDPPARRSVRRSLAALIATVCVLLGTASLVLASPSDIRLRIAWGGGDHQAWRGIISAGKGRFRNLRTLGTERDAPGSVLNDGFSLSIRSPRRRAYEAIDVTVESSADGSLLIELGSNRKNTKPYIAKIPLAKLLSDAHNEAIDDVGNRLLIRRAPGDKLRVNIHRDHLVFAPREPWEIDVLPHVRSLDGMTDVRLQARLYKAGTKEVVWKTQREVPNEADGSLSPISRLAIPVPDAEGVYDLVLQLEPSRLRSLLKEPHRISRSKQGVERNVQFVVVDRGPLPASEDNEWREIFAFNAAEPEWRERLLRFPAWNLLPPTPQIRHRDGDAAPWETGDRILNRLPPDGSQSYPLAVLRTGVPHLLEIECPLGEPQTLAVSIVENDYDAPSTTAEMALSVDNLVATEATRTCRLLFWPRTRSPKVTLQNLRSDKPATFGQIRVLAGPDRLPPSPFNWYASHGFAPLTKGGRRQAMAHVDLHDFMKAFGSRRAIDSQSGRPLTDWQTVMDSSQRLTEYVRHMGYAGAVVTVVSEGGAIYPDEGLDSSTRFDTGPYFVTGQDPIRKDALELLMRMFDRDGLRLIPQIRFNGPLPELERYRRDSRVAKGIELVNFEGRPFAATERSSIAPPYNPLDPRVQAEMHRVAERLMTRYAGHRAFGGLSIELTPDTYTHLPGMDWGYDVATVNQYFQQTGTSQADARVTPDVIAALRNETPGEKWHLWRSDQIFNLYASLAARLRQLRPDSRLFVTGTRLSQMRPIEQAVRPALSRPGQLSDRMLELGFQTERFSAEESIVFVRPRTKTVRNELIAADAAACEFADSSEVERLWEPMSRRTTLLYELPLHSRLAPDASGDSRYGNDRSIASSPRLLSVGTFGYPALIETLAAQDAALALESAPSGLPQTKRRLWHLFGNLPADAFLDAAPQTGGGPLILRTLVQGERTYAYALNVSPWPLQVVSKIQAPADVRLESLSPQLPIGSLERDATAWVWQAEIEPYGMIAGVFSAPGVVVNDVTAELPAQVQPLLQKRISDLVARAAQLNVPRPMTDLRHSGFDEPDSLGLSGWQVSAQAGALVEADASIRRSGGKSLQMQSDGAAAWVRSQPLRPIRTGRVSLKVWLRGGQNQLFTAPGQSTATLRLAIEGRLDGQPYYRYANVSPSGANLATNQEWVPYVLHIDDLPQQALDQLRIRFDFSGPGTVWIDDVHVSDLSFTRSEQRELSKIVALADLQLREGRFADCWQTLSGYWPRYLMQHVTPTKQRLARGPATKQRVVRRRDSAPNRPSMRDQIRN